MCLMKRKHHTSSEAQTSRSDNSIPTTTMTMVEWISEAINGGSLCHVDLHMGTNDWASPPGDLFSLRSKNYLTKRTKYLSGDYLLMQARMNWLKSSTKLDKVLARPNNRVAHALCKAQSQGKSLKSFILAVNLQIPSKDHHNTVFYLELRYVTSITIDMGFVVEGQLEDELSERLFGAVKVCQMEMLSSTVVNVVHNTSIPN